MIDPQEPTWLRQEREAEFINDLTNERRDGDLMSDGELIDIRPVEIPYVLAEYPECGVTYRVESSGMVYFEKSPGNWDFSHNTTTGEYKLARQVHSMRGDMADKALDALTEIVRTEREEQKLKAELADTRKTIKAVAQEALEHWDADRESKVGKLLASLAGNMIGCYRADVDIAMGYSEAITEKAKPQDEMETCCCGREYRAADGKLIPAKLDEIPVCPACFDVWEETIMN